jgi:uncharacterized protein
MPSEFLLYVVVGFCAQLVDGALGMAYGITASSLLLTFGVSPAAASATVHTAECFTTGASALSHRAFGNIDRELFKRLLIPGILGAICGAYILVNLPGEKIKPFIAAYLLFMGLVIIIKAFGHFPPRRVTSHLRPLGFFGAMIDSLGGGGWGPIVASNLIARGNDMRLTIGSVNAVEFFVTFASSATFFLSLGITHWQVIVGLGLGGMLAAPLGAWACTWIPRKPFMVFVGILIVALSARTIWTTLSP